MIRTLFADIIDAVIKWWKKVWFEARLKARLQMIEWQTQVEAELERKERFEPVYQEKPVDEKLQTGESQLLGGEMRLAAKWVIEEENVRKSNEQDGSNETN